MSIDYRCDKCGKEQTAPHLHTVPPGWERIMGNDYCDECMAVINEALARLDNRRKT